MITFTKEELNDLKENYLKVRKLTDEDSKHDPEDEPYASKYAARGILITMYTTIGNLIDKKPECSQKTKLEALLGAVLLNLGIVNMETEEISASEVALSEAEVLLEKSISPDSVITLLGVYNNLGILWSNRNNPETSKQFLLKAKELYMHYKKSTDLPICNDHLFCLSDDECTDGTLAFEKAHTLTLYYLAQIYGSLHENLKSAVYCHVTLKRQLEYKDFDPIDWALNAATLSQFFAEHNGFLQSRHHLAAASRVLQEYQDKLYAEEVQDEAFDARVETYKHRSADVARCWAKYCLMVLMNSRARLLLEAEQTSDVTDLTDLQIEDDEYMSKESLKNLTFPSMDVTEFESKVTNKFLLTFQDAREVFISCLDWLNKAKEYYKIDTLASDYIELIQDSSQAYRYLIFFEEDDERQAKMHKRRINMLEELLKEINPTYYLSYCRQLWYELGEVYADILNIKLDKLNKTNERPTPQALLKINTLSDESNANFEHFLNSVKDKATGILPAKIDEDLIRPVVTAYALIARNKMKKITPNKQLQLENVKKSFEAYKAVVDICDKDQAASKIMQEELSLCKEMVNILPIKIRKLESELLQSPMT